MTVYFQSDSQNTGPGFIAKYHESSSDEIFLDPQCGNTLDDDSGFFSSPNYPANYPNNAKCTWYILVDYDGRVRLHIVDFELEASPGCSNDYVKIHDGPSTNSPVLSTICTGSNHTFTSSSNAMTVYFKSDSQNTAHGFTANYFEMSANKITQCGGIVDDDSKYFVSPNYPLDYPNNAKCTWYIHVDNDERVKLNFFHVELEPSPHCSKDYIKIYDGPSTISPVLSTICTGSNHEFISSSNNMIVYFQSDSQNTASGFTAHYNDVSANTNTQCGGNLDDDSGSFTSPNYPRSYPNNARCTWYIYVDHDERVKLNFIDIQLEATPGCSNDYIKIYDGPSTNSPLLSTICTGSNRAFTSSSNAMTIHFQSDSQNTGPGFTANYFEISANKNTHCGGTLDDDSGSFTSPNYPRNYPNNAKCTWYIFVDSDERIQLMFIDIQLEVTPGCSDDYVKIYDGSSTNSPVLSTICTGSNRAFTSSSNAMTIHFQSDSQNTGPGFTANYYEVSANKNTQCGGKLDDDSGTFTSPNYPRSYPNNAKCTWYIFVDSDERIQIIFIDIQLEATPGCSDDYIKIYDGPSTSSPVLSTICTGSNRAFTSSSNAMTIHFQSDSQNTGPGFTANYFEISANKNTQCGGKLDDDSGTFTSPNYPRNYPNNAKCTWYIFVDSDERIQIIFIDVQLEATPGCSDDYVKIYDGPSTSSPVLSTICTGSNRAFTSSSNAMTIHFQSDSQNTGPGFTANYFEISANKNTQCGGKLDDDSGTFTSPNYPWSYPNNAKCTWHIFVDSDERIQIIFIDIQLEATPGCSDDYIKIYDGPSTNSPVLSTICTGSNRAFTSSSNAMTVYFQSDSQNTGPGFTANYFEISANKNTQCGGKLDDDSGTFTSPNYPRSYPNNTKCTWYIFVDSDERIQIIFIDVQLEATPGCSNDYIKIYDGPSTSSPLLSKICTGSNRAFTSSSNAMTIHFQSDSQNTGPGFTANYYEMSANQNTQCGGKLDDDSGTFTSPNYPRSYPNNAKCTWYIFVDSDERIQIIFIDIQLVATPGCSDDYIKIYDGPGTSSPVLSTICTGSNRAFTSSSNAMTIHFQSDSQNTGPGFTANYFEVSANKNTQCGGKLDDDGGIFTSPNHPVNYPNNAKCTWYIFVDKDERIQLKFIDIQLENSPGCSNDYIKIYDGPSTNSPVLTTICTRSNRKFTSSSNAMTVHFQSDPQTTAPGFTAYYSKVPANQNFDF
ncbi:cubilin-like [Scyliorhinus torazame]